MYPEVVIVIAVFWLWVLKILLSLVPEPDVLSRGSVEDAVVPPITSGVVTDVPIVGEAEKLGAPLVVAMST